jgi:hypothetical protein
LSALDQYSYLFFVCEGKNEEAIVKWLAEADAIDFPKKQYSLDFCRARTKSTRPKILRAATQFDYGGPVAIIYVCDSHGEKWSVEGAGHRPARIWHPSENIVVIICSTETE